MSAPIMSRFDLFFILVDDCNEVKPITIIIIIIIKYGQNAKAKENTTGEHYFCKWLLISELLVEFSHTVGSWPKSLQ